MLRLFRICRRSRILIGAMVIIIAMIPAAHAADDDGIVEFSHRGVLIAGKPAPQGKHYDITITPPDEGAEAVRAALDILYEGSPFTAKAIDKLKAAGNVIILYDPAFPPGDFTKITIAAFLPDYYQKDGVAKDFLAVVGRFGAKWTAKELAPVLAHELTGHGMQHLRGHLDHVREVDLECEAYLYQEKAYQDLGFNKDKREMITFRQTLERHWCADFKAWQKNNRPGGTKNWDKLHPDVPALLEDYLVYIDALRKSGVAGKAVKRAKAAQAKAFQQRLNKLAKSSSAKDHYELAMIYARGVGTDVSKTNALRWFEKAAEAGYPRAQFELSRIYWKGDGVPQDKVLSAEWAKAAAENDIVEAQYIYGAMLINGDGIKRDRANGIAWVKKAADQGYESAVKALKKLSAK